MKIVFKKRMSSKLRSRLKSKLRVRKKVNGTAERPRLNVFRSSRHMYAQLVDDLTGKTLVEASTQSLKMKTKAGNVEAAKAVGAEIAKKAQALKIGQVVFDRNGFLYHGRIKALAESAREAGLKF